ncbi:hypothetical protein [Solimonas sp. SE-A11]|uniref:hypothetical protein n=1 Tax=Solimonas sp. SE-A11 TaxID=3054954 RepID=UPI00259CBBB5|nr:hypothetical protein [Solimonas sp. SE-A11]MDM4770875.1 hypothetical protein [Solimonas sp. SE-A11]
MVNYLDLKYLVKVEKDLRAAADDPQLAPQIKAYLDANPDVRDELADVYVRALRTMERQQNAG